MTLATAVETAAIGLDIGSTAAKAAVVADGELAYTLCVPTGYSGVDAAERLLDELGKQGWDTNVLPVVATGYGRLAVPGSVKAVTEITCHGRGAAFLFGDDGVVVDIGGQDTKCILLKGGRVAKFVMNDKCSAGTGKFLEVMANRMGITLGQLEEFARRGQPCQISSLCTVFAESEVISLMGTGTPREDIARGVVDSVATKVKALAYSVPGVPYYLTGGLCESPYLVERLGDALGVELRTRPEARFAGAIGAALSA